MQFTNKSWQFPQVEKILNHAHPQSRIKIHPCKHLWNETFSRHLKFVLQKPPRIPLWASACDKSVEKGKSMLAVSEHTMTLFKQCLPVLPRLISCITCLLAPPFHWPKISFDWDNRKLSPPLFTPPCTGVSTKKGQSWIAHGEVSHSFLPFDNLESFRGCQIWPGVPVKIRKCVLAEF